MKTKTANIIFILSIALTILAGAILYMRLPDQIVSHWNAAGQADGYMGKFWGVFLFPAIMLFFYALYLVIPKIDPLKANIESFKKQYSLLFVGLNLFFVYVFALAMAWNIGYRFDFEKALIPMFAVLFWVIGSIIESSKRNWFVGIRTPWTLSSDYVWDKTHRLGGKLFKIAAVVPLAGLFFKEGVAFYIFIGTILVVAPFSIIYSYFVYREEKSKKIAR